MKQGTNPDLLVIAGNTYLALKDPAAAEKALRAAIEADPSRNEPMRRWARCTESKET